MTETTEDVAPPASVLKPRRRFPLIPVLAAVALVVGIVVGSFVFGRLMQTPMTAQQQDAWAKLEASGQYDPGSIHLVGTKYGASIWSATRQQGDLPCVVLTRPGPLDGRSMVGCAMPTETDQEMSVQATLTYQEKGVDYALWATLSDDIAGNPAVIVQRQRANEPWDWRMQYSDAELKQAENLVAAGFDGETVSILGYDGDTPVWMGNAPDGSGPCLMVVQDTGVVVQQCGSGYDQVALSVGDTVYGVLTSDRSSMLSITRLPGGAQ
ncbi:hypothetical protein [Microbacterium sp.]|uniref:hypothetical protein n=1 Tax=Microbacterium sp. TaxID=51671 RepID=UPI003A9429EB